MKILGLNGSERKLGNTEILVKEALMGAEEEGAQVEMLRLTDYKVFPCDGLAPCVFGNTRCNLKDDFNFIVDKIVESDGVVLGTPCYILESTAIIKQLIDRVFSVNYRSEARGKPATVIVPYATRGWTPYAFLQPNILFLMLGMEVIDRALVHTQAMNEVVLYDKALARARQMGKEVAKAVKTGDASYRGEPGICPICQDRVLRILRDDETVECGVCGIRGRIAVEKGKIKVHFDKDGILNHRFTQENIYRHFTYHIKPSRDYFSRTRETTKEKRERYREYPKGV
ncbi:MAG: flavodoxin family protein [Pseudobdellovibrionaceae bacterium]